MYFRGLLLYFRAFWEFTPDFNEIQELELKGEPGRGLLELVEWEVLINVQSVQG